MNGKAVKGYLNSVIDSLDTGKVPARPTTPWWVRKVAVPAAFGLAISVSGCGEEPETEPPLTKAEAAAGKADGGNDLLCWLLVGEEDCDICDVMGWYGDGVCDMFCDLEDTMDCNPVMMYGIQPMTETDCSDGWDNDYDGLFDCRDTDCAEDPACDTTIVPMYGVPIEICNNGVDDDMDELVDCSDPSCALDSSCLMQPLYAATFEVCDDGVDNDGDGRIDCADEDCRDVCVAMYGVLYPEDCDDGVDNDGDGLIDCSDSDCTAECVAMYGVLFPEDCDDDIDNDGDGFTDCEDSDCEEDPACMPVMRYMAPMPEDCGNGFDDDRDGFTDCEDSDCEEDPACQ